MFYVYYFYLKMNSIYVPILQFYILYKQYLRHCTPNRRFEKFYNNFSFPSFFDIFFFVPIKKLFLVNFEIFLITGLKDIEFRFYGHNIFKNGSNSIFFFFLKFLFFYKLLPYLVCNVGLFVCKVYWIRLNLASWIKTIYSYST